MKAVKVYPAYSPSDLLDKLMYLYNLKNNISSLCNFILTLTTCNSEDKS